MNNGTKPTVTMVLADNGLGTEDFYKASFLDHGWEVSTRPSLADIPQPAGLVILDFALACKDPSSALRLPCSALAIDLHYNKEYFQDPMAHPFHLLDNSMVIVHDIETKEFIGKTIRPVNPGIIHIPYPAWPSSALEEGMAPAIFSPEAQRGHPWLEGMNPTFVQPPFPPSIPKGSFVAAPEYDPQVWPLVHWAMASGVPAVLPGGASFQKTCFYGSLLFDPQSKEDFAAKVKIMARPAAAKPESKTLRVAVVTPRHEKQTAGGAENHATRLAESFAEAGHQAEILTSRTSSMLTWNNDLPEGASAQGNITIRRFPLDSLEDREHHRLGHMINSQKQLDWSGQTEWMRLGIRSSALDEYIEANEGDYDYFLMIPYLYGVVYWASHKAPEKSLLLPCYHREPAAFTKILNQNAQWMAGVLFNTAAEMKLAREELKIHNPNMRVVGEGIETSAKGDAERFRANYSLDGGFILYVGRFQREKGLEELLGQWKQYVDRSGTKTILALAGKGDMKVADDPAHNIKLLGFLPEQDKLDAIAACSALALPSTRESFSIVMMEAWIQGRPVIASARCDAAREHIFSCKGGLLYDGEEELGNCADKIISDGKEADAMGRRGRDYALKNFQWPDIIDGIVNTLEALDRTALSVRLGKAMADAGAARDLAREKAIRRWLEEVEEKVSMATPLSEESIPELLRKAEDFADVGVDYKEFSHRKAVGGVWSAVRGAMTRHLKVNYLDILEGKQKAFNREAANLLRRLYEKVKDGS